MTHHWRLIGVAVIAAMLFTAVLVLVLMKYGNNGDREEDE